MDPWRTSASKAATAKLRPGWRPGRQKRRAHLAARMIQRCFRSYLLLKAIRANRGSAAQSFHALRAFHHARDRKYWRSVDLRTLTREELRLVALSLNVPSTGKKVLVLGRIQRWVDHLSHVNDVAGAAATKALESHARAQGSVFFCEAYPGAEPIDIRPLRGKGITRIVAGSDSDAVYAVDSTRGALWLCKTGGLASQVGLCSAASTRTPSTTSSNNSSAALFTDPIESRWLASPVFMHTLRTEHVVDVRVARSHAIALAQAGELFSWGENPHGELGFAAASADAVARNRATVVDAIAAYRSIAVGVGRHHTIAVCDDVAGHDGVTFCWGSNAFGQLGTATSDNKATLRLSTNSTVHGASVAYPKPFVMHQVEALRTVNVRSVTCGALHSMALSADGKVYSWGCNDGGRLGHGLPTTKTTAAAQAQHKPALVRGGGLDQLIVLAIACGTWHSACIATDDAQATSGRVFTWGTGIYGQLGAGAQQVLHEPRCVRIPLSAVVDEHFATQLACGMHHTAVLTSDNRVFSWGSVQRFSATPTQMQHRDGAAFGRIASLACGRTFVIFNTVARDATNYEKPDVHRLWRAPPTVIPRLDLQKVPPLPLSSSCYSGKRRHPLPPPRLEPQADRKHRLAEQARDAARIDAIDIHAIVHPLCRVCWRCEGFQPSPLKLWICRHCYHEKQLHGARPHGAPLGEYEAVRKIQCLFRARRARRLMQRARERHYERVFSIQHNEFFYYNSWRSTVSWDRPHVVGVDVDIPIRDPDIEPTIRPPLTQTEAAIVLQCYRRRALARRSVHNRLARMYEKHIDLEHARVYYIQRLDAPFGIVLSQSQSTGASRTTVLAIPPALLVRLYDLGEPIEIQRLKRFAAMAPDDAARVLQTHYRAHCARLHAQRVLASRYKRIFDDATGQFYYYNTVTHVSSWDAPRLLRTLGRTHAPSVAMALAARKRAPRHAKFATRDAAASTIQALFRRYACRTQLLERLSRRYRKLLDAGSGKSYYYDTVAHHATWFKPALFGAFDIEVTDDRSAVSTTTSTDAIDTSSPRRLPPSARKSTLVREGDSVPSSRSAPLPHVSERARIKRHKRRLQKLRQMSRDDAASRIQRSWRGFCARKQLRALLLAAYEQIYDPVTEHFYYYNTKTGVVKWEKPLLLEMDTVRVTRRIKRRRVAPITDARDAASVVQRFVRYCGARNTLYQLLYARIDKVWDASTRRYYYFDRRNGQSSWNKPLTLRHNDLPTTAAASNSSTMRAANKPKTAGKSLIAINH